MGKNDEEKAEKGKTIGREKSEEWFRVNNEKYWENGQREVWGRGTNFGEEEEGNNDGDGSIGEDHKGEEPMRRGKKYWGKRWA